MDNGLLAAFCWGLGCMGEGSKKKDTSIGGLGWAGWLAGYVPVGITHIRSVLCLESYYPFYVRAGPASVLTHGGAAGAWRRTERTIAIPCGPSICS